MQHHYSIEQQGDDFQAIIEAGSAGPIALYCLLQLIEANDDLRLILDDDDEGPCSYYFTLDDFKELYPSDIPIA